MLVKQSYKDVPTTANGVKGTIRIYVIEPNVPEYPEAKFPGCTLPFQRSLVMAEVDVRRGILRDLSGDRTSGEVRK